MSFNGARNRRRRVRLRETNGTIGSGPRVRAAVRSNMVNGRTARHLMLPEDRPLPSVCTNNRIHRPLRAECNCFCMFIRTNMMFVSRKVGNLYVLSYKWTCIDGSRTDLVRFFIQPRWSCADKARSASSGKNSSREPALLYPCMRCEAAPSAPQPFSPGRPGLNVYTPPPAGIPPRSPDAQA